MAPRKEKTEKASADEAPDMILKYLRKQNRPYSATDISANLHNKVSKAAAAKYLKDMHERKEIEGRASGKQIVYHALQHDSHTAPSASDTPTTEAATTAETLSTLTSTRNSLRTESGSLATEAKTLRLQLATLAARPSRSVLGASIAALEAHKAALLARLQPLRGGEGGGSVDAGERERVEAEAKRWKGVEARRRKVRAEMWKVLGDALPEGVGSGDVAETLGLDE